MISPKLLTLCLFLAVLAGCAKLPPAPVGRAVLQAGGAELLADWQVRNPRIRTLQGMAKARVQTAERTLNGTQVVLVESPDRLRTETLTPFGSPLLVLATDSKDLRALLPGENRFYRGRPSPDNLERFTRLSLRLPELVGILLYRPPVIAYREASTWLLPAGSWRVDLDAQPRRQELFFDADRRLTEVRYLYQDELQLSLAYGEFRAESAGFPGRVELALPLQSVRVSLTYSELTLDSELKPGVFELQPVPGMMVVELDEGPAPVAGDGKLLGLPEEGAK